MKNILHNFKLHNKSLDTSFKLTTEHLFSVKEDFKKYWPLGSPYTKSSLTMLETLNISFFDIIVLNIFRHLLFFRIQGEDTKTVLNNLKHFIVISKKEESDFLRNGLNRSKYKLKLFKKIIKKYSQQTASNSQKSIKLSTFKDFVIYFVDSSVALNITEDTLEKELNSSIEKNFPELFSYCFLVALYKQYESLLMIIETQGEIISGEFKVAVQNVFVSYAGTIFKTLTSEHSPSQDLFSLAGMNLVSQFLNEAEVNLQNEKKAYSELYLETVQENYSLIEKIEEQAAELEMFRSFFKSKFKSKKFILIGDKKKEDTYNDIVSSMGATLTMYDSFDDFSKISPTILDGADIIILSTYYTSHSVSNKLKKYSNKTHYLNSSSHIELEKLLLNIHL